MRKLVIVNGPNNNFYGIRNKGQYGNQLYADLIEELKEYGASIGFEVEAFQSNGEGALIDYFQSLYFEAEKSGCKIPLVLNPAGFMGKSFVMRLMHMGKEVYVVGETNTPNFEKDDVLIICSGSGETKQFIQIAEKAKSYGGKLIVFTATPKSTLADMSDCSIVIQAPSKKQDDSAFQSIQPMASLFEQGILLVGDSIVLTMMEHASNNTEMFNRHSNLE